MAVTITSQNWDAVTPPSLPAGWHTSGNVRSFANAFVASAPNAIADFTAQFADFNLHAGAFYGVPTTYVGPDVTLQHEIIPYDLTGAVYLLARADSPVIGACNAYAAEWRGNAYGGGGVAVGILSAGGVFTPLANVTTSSINNTQDYIVKFSVIGSTLSVSIQRKGNNQWLTPGATWQAAEIVAATATDTTIAYGPLVGIGFMNRSVSDQGGGVTPGAASDSFTATYETLRDPAEFYVSPTGNSGNNGTTALTPFDLATANTKAFIPGDTINFFGTSVGMFKLPGSGSANAPITVKVLNATGVISAGNGDGILVQNSEYVTINGLTIVGSGVVYSDSAPYITSNSTGCGVRVLSTLTTGSRLNNITITNNTVSGFYDGVMVCAPVNGLKTFPGDAAAFAGTAVKGFNNITIARNKITETIRNACVVWGSGTSATFGSGALPTGNTIFTNLTMNGNEIAYNYGLPTLIGVGAQPIAIFGTSGFLCDSNFVHDSGQAAGMTSTAGSPGGVGGLVALESTNGIISQNEVCRIYRGGVSVDGCGIDTDGGCTNTIVERNYVHGVEGQCYQNGTFTGSGVNSGNTFRYNIGISGALTTQGGIFGTFGLGACVVHHNTFYLTGSTAGQNGAVYMSGTGGTASFYDNAFIVTPGSGQHLLWLEGGNATFKGNAYRFTDGTIKVRDTNGTYTSLSAWQTASGQEKISGSSVAVTGDPLVRNLNCAATVNYSVSAFIIDSAPVFLPNAAVKNFDSLDLLFGSAFLSSGLDIESGFGLALGSLDFRGATTSTALGLSIGASLQSGVGFYGNRLLQLRRRRRILEEAES